MSVFRHGRSIVVEKILADIGIKTETKIEINFKLVQPDGSPKIANSY